MAVHWTQELPVLANDAETALRAAYGAAMRSGDLTGAAVAACDLAGVLARRGRLAEAEAAYRFASRTGPPTLVGVAALGLAAVLRAQPGRAGEAAAPLRQAADDADPRVRAAAVAGLLTLLDDRELLDLAHRLRAAGRLAEAEPALRRLVNSADPDHARIGASVLGAVLYDLGRIDEAEAAWRLAVQRRDPAAAMGLADLLARRGQHAEALELYHRLRQLDPAAQTDFGLFIRDRIDQLLRYQNP